MLINTYAYRPWMDSAMGALLPVATDPTSKGVDGLDTSKIWRESVPSSCTTYAYRPWTDIAVGACPVVADPTSKGADGSETSKIWRIN